MILLQLLACTTTVRFPPPFATVWIDSGWDSGIPADGEDDDGPRPGPGTRFVVAGGSCDANGSAWTFTFRTDGWTLDGVVDLYRTTDRQTEQHPMRLVATDPAGAWDELSVGPLADGTPPAEQVAGASTRFDCATDAATLTVVARIHDTSGALSDCIVWGADPAGAVAEVRAADPEVTALGGCRDWTP